MNIGTSAKQIEILKSQPGYYQIIILGLLATVIADDSSCSVKYKTN